jgi:hypothetical protein
VKFKAMSGTDRDLIPSYIDEHNWRQFHGKKTLVALDNLLDQISDYYIYLRQKSK